MPKYKFIHEQGFIEHWSTTIEAEDFDTASELFEQYREENDPVVDIIPMLDYQDYEEVQ